MQAATTSFYDWQQRFATEQACLDAIATQRWPEGFRCPHCGHEHGWLYAARHRYECARCYRQTYITSGTAFHGSRVPLTKWFWSLYLVSADKGGISALRLSKIIGVSWRTAYKMLRTLRAAMAARDSLYRLTGLVEVGDAYIGAKKTGKAGRGGGRTPVLVAIEKTEDGKPGFVAIEALDSLAKAQITALAGDLPRYSPTMRRLGPPSTRSAVFSPMPSVIPMPFRRCQGWPRRLPTSPRSRHPRRSNSGCRGSTSSSPTSSASCSAPSMARCDRIACRSTSMSSSIASTVATGKSRSPNGCWHSASAQADRPCVEQARSTDP